MSKPDPSGGSLESILASIRKSLAEQSTDALSQEPAAPQTAAVQRKNGLAQRLAGAAAAGSAPGPAGDDISDLLEDGAGSPAPLPEGMAGAPDASTAPSGGKDPLWFLSRREGPAAADPSAVDAPKAESSPATEPKLTRPEVLRASMPPFFGSSADTAKPLSEEPAGSSTASSPGAQDARPSPAAAPAPRSAKPASDAAAIAREVSLVAAAAESAARPRQSAPAPGINGKADATSGQYGPQDAALLGEAPLNRALEVMVLDLLKPMLRQWLDENMPRLVADALGEEVERTRAARGEPKKT